MGHYWKHLKIRQATYCSVGTWIAASTNCDKKKIVLFLDEILCSPFLDKMRHLLGWNNLLHQMKTFKRWGGGGGSLVNTFSGWENVQDSRKMSGKHSLFSNSFLQLKHTDLLYWLLFPSTFAFHICPGVIILWTTSMIKTRWGNAQKYLPKWRIIQKSVAFK